MPRRDWEMRIGDILWAAQKIVSRTEGLDYEIFAADDWTVDAVLRNLSVIGEAARHLPDEMKSDHPEVPWTDMSDLRNIVVHEYFGVDMNIIWKTIQEDLPVLITQLEAILAETED